jgi:hypothetical protein
MVNQNSHPAGFSKQHLYTLLFTFSYEGKNIELISQQRIEMLPPPPESTFLQEGQSGFWYELQDESGSILYQRSIHNPIKFEMTAYSNDPEIPMKEVTVENPQGVFELLAPDMGEARTLVIFSSPMDPELTAAPASELARFVIDPGS